MLTLLSKYAQSKVHQALKKSNDLPSNNTTQEQTLAQTLFVSTFTSQQQPATPYSPSDTRPGPSTPDTRPSSP